MTGVILNNMGDIILETRDLTKHYGGVHALEGGDFNLRKGEHVAIMGDNGAGKSTFVRQITALSKGQPGKIWFDGRMSISRGRLTPARPGSKRCSRLSRLRTISTCLTTCSLVGRKPFNARAIPDPRLQGHAPGHDGRVLKRPG